MDRIDDQKAVIKTECKSKSSMELSKMECLSTEDLLAVNEKLSPIQEFYYGQSIFITGSTGFIGKLMIEKLLRVCPGLKSIYLLVRTKAGKNIHQRIEEIFDNAVSLIFRMQSLKINKESFKTRIF